MWNPRQRPDVASTFRRQQVYMSTFSLNLLHIRNPWVVMFFAFSYPGFGNLMQHRYIKAFLLIIWESFINHHAKVNSGIMYTLQGHFAQAKAVMNPAWSMLYVSIYVYAIYDSFRTTVDLNKHARLAKHENAPIRLMLMGIWDTNYLDRRHPWVALAWSVLFPGLGHLYVHRVITGIFIFVYTLAIVVYSHIPEATQYTLTGKFAQAVHTVDMQWFLYLPSIYCFVLYDTYVTATENNKLYEREQIQFFKSKYQSENFDYPI